MFKISISSNIFFIASYMLLITLNQALKYLFVLWTFAFIILLKYPKVIMSHSSTSLTTKSPGTFRMPNSAYKNVTNDANVLQKASCSFATGDVLLRAEAKIMQMPNKHCSSDESEAMKTALSNLEKRLSKQLHGIKNLLLESIELVNLRKCSPLSSLTYNTTDQHTKQYANYKNGCSRNDEIENLDLDGRTTSSKVVLTNYQTNEESSVNRHLRKRLLPLQKYPIFDDHSSVFTYNWKLKNFSEHLRNGYNNMLHSPPFTITGKDMIIKVFFRHLQRDFIYLQLCEAKQLKSNRITLESNNSFQEVNISGNTFRYTISILNQNDADLQKNNNLISRQFYQLYSGLVIPNSALLNSPYAKNDSILIQIVIFI